MMKQNMMMNMNIMMKLIGIPIIVNKIKMHIKYLVKHQTIYIMIRKLSKCQQKISKIIINKVKTMKQLNNLISQLKSKKTKVKIMI